MNKNISVIFALVCGVSTLVSCQQTSLDQQITQQTEKQTMTSASVKASALDVGQRVAQWQLNHLDNVDYLAKRYWKGSSEPRGWIQAAFYIGLARWAETQGDKSLVAEIEKMAKSVDYSLLERRVKHADDHAIGQTYLWLTEQTGDHKAYAKIQKLFDFILADHRDISLEMVESNPRVRGFEGACQDRWCWSDALFMAPRTWLKLSNVTGDPKYFEFADKEFWATVDYLFSEKYGLFFRDSHYFDKKSDNGEPVFWSRGNGWVFAALPLIIDDLPKDHPSRSKYIELYKKNAAGLIGLQTPAGYWPASLRDPNKVKTPEISGTGFIVSGLAWGVNNGILTDAKTKDVVLKGWAAIENAVQKNGRVNWVQQVGKSPDPVKKDDTQFYGVGAVLLAAAEMSKWQK
ncbi:glycoside hydrolase family 88/105 protein [Algibacillus agarilyticus]|uniref:glycoside hydrolase family 88/105 protein n=1 Tax=Algibacillus agarilyticus TaxID=2234133 RepID=UPI000DD04055|nr:glycoside hydrolase family 88 protein [Algibacillus agarilyticus]